MDSNLFDKTIEDISFGVRLESLYYGNENNGIKRKITGHKCIVNENTGNAISIVSNSYNVITHLDSYKVGLECMHKLFKVNVDEITIFKVISSNNGSVAMIDLIHKTFELNIWKKEIYVPFIRVTNSYNKSRALRFDLGFVRKLCSNGIIFEQETIQFNFPHTRNATSKIEFDLPKGKMEKLTSDFENRLNSIKEFEVDENLMLPLFFKAIYYNLNTKKSIESKKRLDSITQIGKNLLAKYEKDFGNNVYTVFNAATDFASSLQNKDNSSSILISGYQRKCGNWLINFNAEKSNKGFSMKIYLKDYSNMIMN